MELPNIRYLSLRLYPHLTARFPVLAVPRSMGGRLTGSSLRNGGLKRLKMGMRNILKNVLLKNAAMPGWGVAVFFGFSVFYCYF